MFLFVTTSSNLSQKPWAPPEIIQQPHHSKSSFFPMSFPYLPNHCLIKQPMIIVHIVIVFPYLSHVIMRWTSTIWFEWILLLFICLNVYYKITGNYIKQISITLHYCLLFTIQWVTIQSLFTISVYSSNHRLCHGPSPYANSWLEAIHPMSSATPVIRHELFNASPTIRIFSKKYGLVQSVTQFGWGLY
jgi:hypothetical protein